MTEVLIEPVTWEGRDALRVYMDKDWEPVPKDSPDAVNAKVLFPDGTTKFFKVESSATDLSAIHHLYGTTEGQIKGWETRHAGGVLKSGALKEKPTSYFNITNDTPSIPVSQLRPGRSHVPEEDIARAEGHMLGASKGEGLKRNPIDVEEHDDGTYTVLDGYLTALVAKKHGWKHIPVHVTKAKAIEREHRYQHGFSDGFREFLLYGTSEGIIKGWETRRRGGDSDTQRTGGKTVFVGLDPITHKKYGFGVHDGAADNVMGKGADLAKISMDMLDEVPGDLSVEWDSSGPHGKHDTLEMRVAGGGMVIHRTFKRNADGTLTAHHNKVVLPKDKQGAGLAKILTEGSFRQYEALGVTDVHLTANIDVGGYAWAKFGFKASRPQKLASDLGNDLTRRIEADRTRLSPAMEKHIRETIETHKDDPKLPWHIAGIVDKDGTKVGKALLLGTSWQAHMDLNDTEAMARLNKYVATRHELSAWHPMMLAEPPSPPETPLDPSPYSENPDGTKEDAWIWDELLGDDDADDEYTTVIAEPTSLYRDKLKAFQLYGTSEGILKGWETRRRGGGGAKEEEDTAKGGPVAGATSRNIASVATVRKYAEVVSERLNYDVDQIDIVEQPPREFEVAGRTLIEGGHYSPATDRIQINADVLTDDPAIQGLVAHEIMHAQHERVEQIANAEHDAMHQMLNDSTRVIGEDGKVVKEAASKEYDRLFGRNGYPRDRAIAELEARFPASAAMAKTAPMGDPFLGTWTKGEDGKYHFDDKEHRERLDRMIKEDGFTAYSKLYWEQEANDPKLNARRRAVQETLAEVAKYHDRAARGPWKEGVPSKAWQEFYKAMRDVYPHAKAQPDPEKTATGYPIQRRGKS